MIWSLRVHQMHFKRAIKLHSSKCNRVLYAAAPPESSPAHVTIASQWVELDRGNGTATKWPREPKTMRVSRSAGCSPDPII